MFTVKLAASGRGDGMRIGAGGWIRVRAVAGDRLTLNEIAWGDRIAVHSALRMSARAVAMANGDLLCRVLGRYKMLADGRDLSMSPHLALDGYWEMPLTRALLRLLRPGMRVADVGANVGYFTVLMGAAVGPSGRVSAFEPNPRAVERLRRNVELNGLSGRVRVQADAVGAHEGEALHLNCDPEHLGGGHLGHPSRVGLERTPVTGRRLDATPGASELELVKIDAEGSEPAVWSGMSGLLRGPRLKTVILEWAPSAHPDPAAALAGYVQAGFGLGLLDRQDGVAPADAATLLALPGGAAHMLVLRR